jgi:hypothetical protein
MQRGITGSTMQRMLRYPVPIRSVTELADKAPPLNEVRVQAGVLKKTNLQIKSCSVFQPCSALLAVPDPNSRRPNQPRIKQPKQSTRCSPAPDWLRYLINPQRNQTPRARTSTTQSIRTQTPPITTAIPGTGTQVKEEAEESSLTGWSWIRGWNLAAVASLQLPFSTLPPSPTATSLRFRRLAPGYRSGGR